MTAVVSSGAAFGRAKRKPLGKGALCVSVSLHLAVLAFLFKVVPALVEPDIAYEVVSIEMVAAAPEPEDQLVVETPEDPPPAPPEEDAPVAEPDPDPEPEPDTTETPPVIEETPPPDPEESDAAEVPDDGEDAITREVETFLRDYPEYYKNITNHIQRCFRWTGSGRLEVVMTFRILRDGSVPDFEVAESSGDLAFDNAAEAAIECAGTPERMGPLPEDYPFEFLPVRYTITSTGGSREPLVRPLETVP